jgi:hypothetical protein
MNNTKYNVKRVPDSDHVYQFISEGLVIVEGTEMECFLALQYAIGYELNQLRDNI